MKKKYTFFFLLHIFLVGELAAQQIFQVPPVATNRKIYPSQVLKAGHYNGQDIFIERRETYSYGSSDPIATQVQNDNVGSHALVWYSTVDADNNGVYEHTERNFIMSLPLRLNTGGSGFFGSASFLLSNEHFHFVAQTANAQFGHELGYYNLATSHYSVDYLRSPRATFENIELYNGEVYALVTLEPGGSIVYTGTNTTIVANDSGSAQKKQAALIKFPVGNLAAATLVHHFKDSNSDYRPFSNRKGIYFTTSGNPIVRLRKPNFAVGSPNSLDNHNTHFVQLDSAGALVNEKVFIGDAILYVASNGEFITGEIYENGSTGVVRVERIGRWNTSWGLIDAEEKMFNSGAYINGNGRKRIVHIGETPSSYKIFEGFNGTSVGETVSHSYFEISKDLRRTRNFVLLETDYFPFIDVEPFYKRISSVDETGYDFDIFLQEDPEYSSVTSLSGHLTLGGLDITVPSNYNPRPDHLAHLRKNRTVFARYVDYPDNTDLDITLGSLGVAVHDNARLDGNQIVAGDKYEKVLVTSETFTVGQNVSHSYFSGAQSSGWTAYYGQNTHPSWPHILHPHEQNYALVREKNGVKFVDILTQDLPIADPSNVGSMVGYAYTSNSKIYRIYLIDPTSLSLDDQDKDQFLLYPNPTTGKVYIGNLDSLANLTLYSLLGQKILSQKVSESQTYIDLEPFKDGVYVLHIDTGNAIVQKRIVKH